MSSARKATTSLEVMEHGRWWQASRNMPSHYYNEWEVPEHIKLTLLCLQDGGMCEVGMKAGNSLLVC